MVGVPKALERPPQPFVETGIPRLKGDRLPIVPDRPVLIPDEAVVLAEPVVGADIVGFYLEDPYQQLLDLVRYY